MPFSRIKLARDGQVKEGKRWISTPMDVAKEVSSRREAAGFVIARVDGALWDMARPLEGDCQLELLGLDSKDGQDTFWHSSAHILGEVGYCRL
jgi:threonyl-tRNA synthetase